MTNGRTVRGVDDGRSQPRRPAPCTLHPASFCIGHWSFLLHSPSSAPPNPHPHMKKLSSSLLAWTLPCLFVVNAAPLRAAPRSSAPQDHIASGNFQTGDGRKGTYSETFTVSGSVTTDTVVYTLTSSAETSTVTTTTTANTDGTQTVEFSNLGFGATTAFASTTNYTLDGSGDAVGTGTFTAADGTTGALTAVRVRAEHVSTTSFNFTSTAGALTRQVRLEARGGPGDLLKVADVDVLGTLTTTTILRSDDAHHPHP